ncbi:MAG: FAD-dependent oxidoreductase, partial [Rhodospirillaceae bacterium]|nr:FAD-dependent oxidoreductase [Rhodospirillaceae bacterium]
MSRHPAMGRLLDRDRPLSFTFDGKSYRGYQGDTLASALMANNIRVLGRSFKYHRPRGIFGAGSEDPSALVQLRTAGRTEPNIRATQVELYDGLVAHSQNNWPSLDWDLGAVLGLASKFLPAGFYYKTFMWPAKFWPHYERLIRNMAGMGRSAETPDPDRYEKRHAHCDVLVIGGGPTGRAAALAAAKDGSDVWLVDENAHIEELDGVTVMARTTAFGKYDDSLYGLLERTGDHLAAPKDDAPRQILWLLRAGRMILASGAIERPLLFANNDRPGIMLAGAAARFLADYGVCPGKRAVIVTNNDSAYAVAQTLIDGGIDIAAIIDQRHLTTRREIAGCEILHNHGVIDTAGRRGLTRVTVAPLDVNGDAVPQSERLLDCDLLCVAGGFTPSVHLYSQAGGKLTFRDDIQTMVPHGEVGGITVVGAANGELDGGVGEPLNLSLGRAKQFIDLQNDVTAADVELAAREGYQSVEHLKRYTTLGMGTDQGKTSNLNGIAVLA